MRTELASFFAALRFFSRLPVPAWVGHDPEQLYRAARYLPLVGIIVGAIGATVTWLAGLLWPQPLAILAGMIATLLATGAFHEDGLADSVDGFSGGWDKEKILAIMKDPHIGSHGAIAVALALLVKFNALAHLATALPVPQGFPSATPTLLAVLVAGHAASRFAAVTLMAALDYVREDASTKSKPLARRMGKGELALAALCGLAPCLLLPVSQVAVALVLAAVVTLLAARYFVKRIGGYTGDCLGATQQVAELAFYLGLLLCAGPTQAQHAPLWGAASSMCERGGAYLCACTW